MKCGKDCSTDGDSADTPEYLVAAKTVKVKEGKDSECVAAENELMQEALLMAQVKPHTNLVSIIGVITRGRPKALVLSFCEYGELVWCSAAKRRCVRTGASSSEASARPTPFLRGDCGGHGAPGGAQLHPP